MAEPEKPPQQKPADDEPDFFAGPSASPRVHIPDPAEQEPLPGAGSFNAQDPHTGRDLGGSFSSEGANEGSNEGSDERASSTPDEGSGNAFDRRAATKGSSIPIKAELPPFLRLILGQYLQIALKLVTAPKKFFQEVDENPDTSLKEPMCFLGISAVAEALLTALMKFNLFVIPKLVLGEFTACFVIAGLASMMAQGMGSKVKFHTCFRMFAYLTCLNVLTSIPGMGLVMPIVSLVFTFFGLRQILKVNLYQTTVIMILLTILNMVLAISRGF